MFARITRLRYWKSEHDETTCEDAYDDDASRGLFVVADGAGTTLFSNIWASTLVDNYLEVPLMSDDPFEVEWWLRRAQERYKPPQIENAAWNARQKMQSQGSHSTLASLRFMQIEPRLAMASLLVFGDSCVLINKASSEEVSSFPLDRASDFDRAPICLPSKISLFQRHFHTAHVQEVEFAPGDRVILATDAVSRWIVSSGDGLYTARKMAFDIIFDETPESWPHFIRRSRESDAMVDDDSTALILALQEEQGEGSVSLGVTTAHAPEIRRQRAEDYRHADLERNNEQIAVLYGDGTDLKFENINLRADEIEYARRVANAQSEVLAVLRRELNKPQMIERVGATWRRYADLLSDEPGAATLRQTLRNVGVIVDASPQRPEGASSVSTKRQMEAEEQLRQEREKHALEKNLLSALVIDDDEAIVAAHQTILESPYKEEIALPENQMQKILRARINLHQPLSNEDDRNEDFFDGEESGQTIAAEPYETAYDNPYLTDKWIEKLSLVRAFEQKNKWGARFSNSYLKHWASELLQNDPYVRCGIDAVNHQAGYKALDPQAHLMKRFQQFNRGRTASFMKLLRRNDLTEDDVALCLLFILRSEIFEDYLNKQGISLASWIEQYRQYVNSPAGHGSMARQDDYQAAVEGEDT